MTYQQYFEQLQKDFAEKADIYLSKEKEMAKTNGLGDMKVSDDYFKARTDWQIASNNYWGFLSFFNKSGLNPNDEIKP